MLALGNSGPHTTRGRAENVNTTDQRTLEASLLGFMRDEVILGNEPLEATTDLVMTGLVDSLGVVRIVGWLEDRFGIEIDPGDVVIEHFESVAAMVAYLRGRGDCLVD